MNYYQKTLQHGETKNEVLYGQIANAIIEYSCKYNEYVLPVYAYSLMHRNRASVIETTVECIVEAYYRKYDRRGKKDKEITQALLQLADELKDDAGNTKLSAQIYFDEEYVDIECLKDVEKATDIIGYRQPIRYEVDTSFDENFRFTKLTYEEYDYIIEWCREHNRKGRKSINSIKVFNMYMLLKMFIARNEGISKLTGEQKETYMSIDTLAKKLSCGINTAQTYLKLLQDMKMIHVKIGDFKKGKANVYKLDDSWTDADENGQEEETNIRNEEDVDDDFDY